MHLYTDEDDIDTTANHPFYVIGKGWVAAGDLAEGDKIYNLDETTSTILDYEVEVLDEPTLVYNLEVEDFHSYFVGCVPVLVHNCKTSDSSFESVKAYKNSKGEWTNGKYKIDEEAMKYHTGDSTVNSTGKSRFLYDVDANQATLDAALYADKYNLWKPSSGNIMDFADKARVPVTNGVVGVTGSGSPTSYINVYRTKTNLVHGSPASP